MSVEEHTQKKKQSASWGLSNFHQVRKHIGQLAKNGDHIETENHAFEVTTSHGFRYGLLSATVERPPGHSAYKARSFLELNMLLGLDESWAHPEVDTVCKTTARGRCDPFRPHRVYPVPQQLPTTSVHHTEQVPPLVHQLHSLTHLHATTTPHPAHHSTKSHSHLVGKAQHRLRRHTSTCERLT